MQYMCTCTNTHTQPSTHTHTTVCVAAMHRTQPTQTIQHTNHLLVRVGVRGCTCSHMCTSVHTIIPSQTMTLAPYAWPPCNQTQPTQTMQHINHLLVRVGVRGRTCSHMCTSVHTIIPSDHDTSCMAAGRPDTTKQHTNYRYLLACGR